MYARTVRMTVDNVHYATRIGFLENVLTAIQDTILALILTTATENGMYQLASFAMKVKQHARLQEQATAMEIG